MASSICFAGALKSGNKLAWSCVFGCENFVSSSTTSGLRLNLTISQKRGRELIVSSSASNSTSKDDKRHVVVTGGNSGIGKSTALELARQGMVVTLACRNEKAGKDAAEEITRLTNNKNVSSMILNLGSLDSVRQFAAEYKDTGLALNVLVNNAGIMACPQSYTEDGFETQFGVNHLGHFLLTALLMDKLAASASEGVQSRVVVLASAAHRIGDIDFNDLNYKNSRAYNNWGAYGQSKLANCLFSLELAKRVKQLGLPIISNSMHPGIVDTQLIRYVFPQGLKKEGAVELPFQDGVRSFLLKLLGLRTPDEGASTAIYLASSPKVKSSGLYYEDCTETNPSAKATDRQLASRLWDVSVDLTGAAKDLAPLGLCRKISVVK